MNIRDLESTCLSEQLQDSFRAVERGHVTIDRQMHVLDCSDLARTAGTRADEEMLDLIGIY